MTDKDSKADPKPAETKVQPKPDEKKGYTPPPPPPKPKPSAAAVERTVITFDPDDTSERFGYRPPPPPAASIPAVAIEQVPNPEPTEVQPATAQEDVQPSPGVDSAEGPSSKA